jgi:non-heme chloroperoxidase
MILRRFIYIIIAMVLILAIAVALAIAFGGPGSVSPLASINDPFKDVDNSDLPKIEHYQARDGSSLAFRHYAVSANAIQGSVVLVHGSSASGQSMHVLAKQFAAQGFSTYSLDIRGHGESGTRGTIAYIGQLEDDLVDFMETTKPASPSTLVGLSAGGGFALRFASGENEAIFQSYLLLTPFLSQSAPTSHLDGGGWVSVGIPRLISLTILNNFGITQFNDLPVMNYALNDKAKQFLTPTYSYSLATNFRPRPDYKNDMRRVKRPCMLIAGTNDEIFYAEKFEQVIHAEQPDWPVLLVPDAGHTSLIINPESVSTIVANVERLQGKQP